MTTFLLTILRALSVLLHGANLPGSRLAPQISEPNEEGKGDWAFVPSAWNICDVGNKITAFTRVRSEDGSCSVLHTDNIVQIHSDRG